MAYERSLCYEPEPFGLWSAREAISRDLERHAVTVSPERIVLTASTSEAYSLLLKLLCDPGDTVLAPRPSYPLVEHLTDLEGVSLEHYRLEFHGRWEIDVDGLREKACSGRMRAIIMISPNNPTGSTVADGELDAIASIAREHDLALISDEVFADYRICRRCASQCAPAIGRADICAGRAFEVCRPAAGEAWLDCRRRRYTAGLRCTRSTRDHLRRLFVGVDAGTGGGAGFAGSTAPPCARRFRTVCARITAR